MPLQTEANNWPFARKKQITDHERKEVLMLKDIYSMGICILEMMIGRVSENRFSISIDSLPLTWAELPQSTPLIQVLVECISIDQITQRKEKLQKIKKLLIQQYKHFFNKPFYKFEQPFVSQRPEVLNRKAVFAFLREEFDQAQNFWKQAVDMDEQDLPAKINSLLMNWQAGVIDEIQLEHQMEPIKDSAKFDLIKGLVKISNGYKQEGINMLKKVI